MNIACKVMVLNVLLLFSFAWFTSAVRLPAVNRQHALGVSSRFDIYCPISQVGYNREKHGMKISDTT